MDPYLVVAVALGIAGVVTSAVMFLRPVQPGAAEPLSVDLQKIGLRLQGDARGFALVCGLALMVAASLALLRGLDQELAREREALKGEKTKVEEGKQQYEQALLLVKQSQADLELTFPKTVDASKVPTVQVIINKEPGPPFVPKPMEKNYQAKIEARYNFPAGAVLRVRAEVPNVGWFESEEFRLSPRTLEMVAAQ